MIAANDRAYDTDLLDVPSTRVMAGDGAMGTPLQDADLTLDDFNNLETIHRNHYEAGADAVEAKYVRLQSG